MPLVTDAALDSGPGSPVQCPATDGGAGVGPSCAPGLPASNVINGLSRWLAIEGDGGDASVGLGDPSIVYPLGASEGAMAISIVSLDPRGYLEISTEIATSTDNGTTWTAATVVNANATDGGVTTMSKDPSVCPDGGAPCTVSGVLVHETPSLVDDATDPDPSARYKLVTHNYLETVDAMGTQHLDLFTGYLAEYTAPAARGPYSPEVKLFGWTGASPLSSVGAQVNVNELPGLADCLVVAEPGMVVTSSGLDVAVTCIHANHGSIVSSIELLRSPDHGKSWSHVSTMLDGSHASSECGLAVGYSGGDLFLSGGTEYLVASTGGAAGNPNLYNAALVYRVQDIDAGILENDAGSPVVLRRMVNANGGFFGACTYAEGAPCAGYVCEEQFPMGPLPLLRVYSTHLSAP
jgi:hypothetical protein